MRGGRLAALHRMRGFAIGLMILHHAMLAYRQPRGARIERREALASNT